MKFGAPPGSSPAATDEPLLSLQLRLPDRLMVPDPETSKSGDGVILHIEIRNRTDRPWESRASVGPLLEIVHLAESGEVPLLVKPLPMLAYPAELAPGRGFLLPVRVFIRDIPPAGASYRVRIRVSPGAEDAYGALRFEPRS